MAILILDAAKSCRIETNLTGLGRSLGLGTDNVGIEVNTEEGDVLTSLASEGAGLMLCVLHHGPYPRKIKLRLCAKKQCIVVYVSSEGKLEIGDSFQGGIAIFKWPINFADQITELGRALANNFGENITLWSATPEDVLRFLEAFFHDRFVLKHLEHVVAAYLLRKFRQADATKLAAEIGVFPEVAKLSADDLKNKLESFINSNS